jgi:hypothetical protein
VGGDTAPATLPGADVVARGWVTQTEAGARYVVPDAALAEAVVAARCDALLDAVDASDDVALLLAVAERVHLGDAPEPWVDSVADRAVAVAKRGRRRPVAWDVMAALDAAAFVMGRAGERRAAADVIAMRDRVGTTEPDPVDAPPGIRVVAWLRRRLVRARPGGLDLLPGLASSWAGQGIEVHEAEAGGSVVGFAVRWHGERPALIWDVCPAQVLRCPGLDPAWTSGAERGEALLGPFSPRPG